MPLIELITARVAAISFGCYAGYLFAMADRTDALLAVIVSLLMTIYVEVRLGRDQ